MPNKNAPQGAFFMPGRQAASLLGFALGGVVTDPPNEAKRGRHARKRRAMPAVVYAC
ncbi:hypothetical protein HMPREF9080_01996 [Cardiobacterium valvarum F0432]|uniref:Uncharacterized protein n=1 Tax=Cardiobacterium valvarum F0432 TaxID=797473 RepID=G9ZGV1_9GAMM|nr:hypothetical protein HMPREF9080_01996 [Cardiobacterium valvarum F0432]